MSNRQIQQYQSVQQQQTNAANLPSTVAAFIPTTSVDNYVSSIVTSNSEVASNTAANPFTSLIRSGMKREANIASGSFENDLEMHVGGSFFEFLVTVFARWLCFKINVLGFLCST